MYDRTLIPVDQPRRAGFDLDAAFEAARGPGAPGSTDDHSESANLLRAAAEAWIREGRPAMYAGPGYSTSCNPWLWACELVWWDATQLVPEHETQHDTSGPGVYRLFDSTGTLLYIGRTVQFAKRLRWHRRHQPWADEIHAYTWQPAATLVDAIDAERRAITNERPIYNEQGAGW